MYVTGRNGTGTGTILSSLAQSSKTMAIEEVTVVSRNRESAKVVRETSERINGLLQSSLKITFQPLGEKSKQVLTALHAEKKFDACIISVPDHLHCIDVILHYSGVILHCSDVVLHYSDVILHYSDVVLHCSDVIRHYAFSM